MVRRRALFLVLAIGVAVSVSVSADSDPDVSFCPVVFDRSYEMFDQFEYDTGWLGIDPVANPDDLGIGMRIFVHAAGEVKTHLPGQAVLENGISSYELAYEGDQDEGELELDVGVMMAGKFAYNLGIFGSGITDLPLVPNFDFLFYDLEYFTPFLLDGSQEAPVVASEEIEEAELYTLDIVEVLTGVDIPGLGGGIVIYAGGEVSAELGGERMRSYCDGSDEELIHEEEGQSVEWPGDSALVETGGAAYEADVAFQGRLDLTPTAFLEIPLFGTWEIIDITIPIDLVDIATTWEYDEQPLSFDVSGFEQGEDPSEGPADAGVSDETPGTSGCGCDAAGGSSTRSVLGVLLGAII